MRCKRACEDFGVSGRKGVSKSAMKGCMVALAQNDYHFSTVLTVGENRTSGM